MSTESSSIKKEKALIIDIDNTLTPPRKPLNKEVAEILMSLEVPFYVAAGSDLALIYDQFFVPLQEFGFRGEMDAFLCNGATRYRCTFSQVLSIRTVSDFDFRSYLGEADFNLLLSVIECTLDSEEFKLPPTIVILGPRIVFRHSMLNVAPIGRPETQLTEEAHANRTAFVSFDGQTGYRLSMLECLNAELADLRQRRGLTISLGGQTSFDFVIDGNDKSSALRTLLDEGFDGLTFIGDALYEGGNDEAIKHFIASWAPGNECPVQAIQVQNWQETVMWLKEHGFVKARQ